MLRRKDTLMIGLIVQLMSKQLFQKQLQVLISRLLQALIIAMTRFVPWWYAQTEVSHQFQMELAAELWLIVRQISVLASNLNLVLEIVNLTTTHRLVMSALENVVIWWTTSFAVVKSSCVLKLPRLTDSASITRAGKSKFVQVYQVRIVE